MDGSFAPAKKRARHSERLKGEPIKRKNNHFLDVPL